MFELILLFIALVGSFIAGIYDLKTTNVPDKVCLAMIILGLLTHIYSGAVTGDFTNLRDSLIFGGVFLAFGIAMYYTGQWGGGDGELLLAIGVVLPHLSFVNTYFPFAISFFINSFFVGAIYAIIFSLFMMYQNRKIYRSFKNRFKDKQTRLVLFSLAVVSILFLISYKIFLFSISSILVALIVFQKFAKSVEEGFLKRIPVSKLKIDDTIGQNIPDLGIYQKLIRGLTKEEVRKIKRHKKYIIIKEGIRYGIVFPLTLVFTLLFGDLIFLFFHLL